MNERELGKKCPELFEIWVRNEFKYGDNPIPQKGKNYILAIVSESDKCFVLLEYNDGWIAKTVGGQLLEINIHSKEIISYSSKGITENNFLNMLIDIIKVYSLNNELIVCNRTNGAGRVIFDLLKKEIVNMLVIENVRFFPTCRRSKYGKELFTDIGKGWLMSASDEKECFDAMKTSLEQRFFALVSDKSKQMFSLLSNDDGLENEPFFFCWSMLSYIRLSAMYLFEN